MGIGMGTEVLDANALPPPPTATPLSPACPCIPPCRYCAHILCSCASSSCFLSISAICTYDGGGTASDAANGSPPATPSGPGSARMLWVPGSATLLALPDAACARAWCRTAPWSYIPCRRSGSIPPPRAAVCFDRLLAVSTSASSQSAFPGSAAGVCHAEVVVSLGAPSSDGNATQLPFADCDGASEKSASASLFPCSSAAAADSLRSTRSLV
uniref:Predicted protein n=1 Tax=Hordeum vulgare subsp. vulgare TaxID=112509 RepID=F2CXF4_HORVV|nr:predicted protein [Hordeum vulgare subsp. vulgare]